MTALMLRRLAICSTLAGVSLVLSEATVGWTPAFAATFTVDTTEDGEDATPGDGQCTTNAGACSLRGAIQEANQLLGPDVVILPAGTYIIAREGKDEDRCATGDLDIKSMITITGAGAATTIIDANHRDRALDVHATGAAVVSGVTLTNGSADTGGGVRVEGGVLKLVESTVQTNQAADAGGGIDNDFGVIEVVRSTIADNVAHNTGGSIENTGTATLRNSPSAATRRTCWAAASAISARRRSGTPRLPPTRSPASTTTATWSS